MDLERYVQKQDNSKFHPVSYFSRPTSEAEEKYHSFELKSLAIIYALCRFRVYHEGLAKKSLNPRIACWALKLENYQYTIVH